LMLIIGYHAFTYIPDQHLLQADVQVNLCADFSSSTI